MQVKEIKSDGLSKEIKVTLPAKEIEEKISIRLKEIAKTAQIPGFRPGKVPESMLRKRYGPSIMGEILERAVGDSSQQALAEKGVRPASQPEIEITSFEDGKDLEYLIKLEMIPDIKPVDFNKIKLERLVPSPKNEDIDKALENIANANKTNEIIKKKRKSKLGDMLIIDFTGSVNGEEFPGGKADDYQLELGSNSFIPGFEDQLIGKNTNNDVEVKVTFPENYGSEQLAGKDASFKVKIKKICETKPAKIDEDLAKKVGMESLEKLKETIAEEQSKELKQLSRLRMKRNLLDVLYKTSKFEVPEKMLESEFNSIWEQHLKQNKLPTKSDKPKKAKNSDESKQKKEYREIALRRVRLGLLMSEIGRENNIQINQDDLNQAMSNEAKKYPGDEQKVMEHLQKNQEAMQQLSAPLYEEKVVDFIFEMAQISDKKINSDDFMKILAKETEKETETHKEQKATKNKDKPKKEKSKTSAKNN